MSSARNYRLKINNGPVTRRATAVSAQSRKRERRPRPSAPAGGLPVMTLIILAGGLITTFSLIALNYQFDIDRIQIADVKLKEEVHHLGKAQRAEEMKREQTLNDVEKMALSEAGFFSRSVSPVSSRRSGGAAAATGSTDLLSGQSPSGRSPSEEGVSRQGVDQKAGRRLEGSAFREWPESERARTQAVGRDRAPGRDDH
jgi:hypothetical protein